MKYKSTKIVYRDKVTGLYYTEKNNFRPLVALTGEGKPELSGVVLTQTGDYNPEWPAPDFNKLYGSDTEDFGYPASCFGQDLLVTEEGLASRFENMGKHTVEYSTLKTIAHYEEECCDFSQTDWVADLAIRLMARGHPHQATCVMHTLIEHYINTAVPEDKRAGLNEIFHNE